MNVWELCRVLPHSMTVNLGKAETTKANKIKLRIISHHIKVEDLEKSTYADNKVSLVTTTEQTSDEELNIWIIEH